jgi:uncharacterized membrane protein (UPF0127 family)
MKFVFAVFAVGLALVACDQGGALRVKSSADETQTRATEALTIVTSAGPREFRVEVADDPNERALGLMYRSELAPDAGMIFDFEEPRDVSMWMKNTYIPLDMLFIRADGTIARIAENAEPHSLDAIPSGEPVLAVLEVAGGTAERLGIKAGDRVEYPLFGSG